MFTIDFILKKKKCNALEKGNYCVYGSNSYVLMDVYSLIEPEDRKHKKKEDTYIGRTAED